MEQKQALLWLALRAVKDLSGCLFQMGRRPALDGQPYNAHNIVAVPAVTLVFAIAP